MKRVLLACLLALLAVPVGDAAPNLHRRSLGGRVLSEAVDAVPPARELAYAKVATLVPYVREASAAHRVPANVLLAVLYEEALHRKPVDLRTFGVSQLGVGELLAQGLPPDPALLGNDRLSVWLLARKLRRLQLQHRSLQVAVSLHNGYSDYLQSVRARARDPRLLALLSVTTVRGTVVV